MNNADILWTGIILGFIVGGYTLGAWLSARRWRNNADANAIHRIESGGKLYKVRRDG